MVLIAFGLGVRVGCVLGFPGGLRNTGFLGWVALGVCCFGGLAIVFGLLVDW